MAKDKQPDKEQIKVTDKRIFTPEGEIREEFRSEIKPADLSAKPAEKPAAPRQEPKPAQQASQQPQRPQQTQHDSQQAGDRRQGGDRRRTMADRAANPGTPFTNFLEPLIAQAYMSLGMLPNPYQPQTKADVGAARQMIDILSLLQEKTQGNLTPDEDDFLNTYLGELKLAFVKITKNLA
ncbi:MAG TPA: DUF1844 domain-containing protein [Thermoanaerobaculia bacterium]|nr:DUF1844 domain-containing protein [Thermoanaerobaculia bacterium]